MTDYERLQRKLQRDFNKLCKMDPQHFKSENRLRAEKIYEALMRFKSKIFGKKS
jgi:hypothetical protein